MKGKLKLLSLLLILLTLSTACSKNKALDMTYVPVPKENNAPIVKEIDKQYKVYYEIFPRTFRDSNGDGIGDIKGIIGALDYLKDLGINGIWITPLTKSPSEHKYDTTDYLSIDPEYGTNEDYKELINEAHKRGISIIMDFVANHVGSSNPWYQDAIKNTKSPYREYFRWIKKDTNGYDINICPWDRMVWIKIGDYYNYCLFSDTMPDLNYESVKVRNEMKKNAKYWIDMGVDGFRLDAANKIYGPGEYPEQTNLVKNNIAWWSEFSTYVRSLNPHFVLFGEVWDADDVISPYLVPFDGCFNFTIQDNLTKVINNGFGTGQFSQRLQSQYKAYSDTTKDYMDLPFLTNHDQDRVMGKLENDIDKAKLAANIYLTLPGSPFIYAGEEIGMTAGNMRTPIKWFDEYKVPETNYCQIANSNQITSWEKQKDDKNSLFNHYKEIIKVREGSTPLMKGDYKTIDTGLDEILGYSRNIIKDGNTEQTAIVLHNISLNEQTVKINDMDLSSFKIYYESNKNTIINGNELKIPPQATVILQK